MYPVEDGGNDYDDNEYIACNGWNLMVECDDDIECCLEYESVAVGSAGPTEQAVHVCTYGYEIYENTEESEDSGVNGYVGAYEE